MPHSIRKQKEDKIIESAGGHQIHLQRQDGEHDGEIKLACWSEQRAMKDQSINERFREKFEQELKKASGLVRTLTWHDDPQPASKQTHPGVYKLRTTLTDWDDKTLHIRQATQPEEELGHLYKQLGISPVPGDRQRLII